MRRLLISGLIVLLVAAVALEGVIILKLRSRVDELEPPQSRRALSPGETPTPTPVPVSGVTPATSYVADATADVEIALRDLAQAQQAFRDQTREFAGDLGVLAEHVAIPPGVEIIQLLVDPTAFCIEAAHVEIKGAHRRFLSTTGLIDFGICNSSLPASQQVPQPVPDEGEWVITGVDLVDITKKEDGYKTYKIPYKATWTGTGDPAQAQCTWSLFDRTGGVIDSGEYGFQVYEKVVKESYRVGIYDRLYNGPPTRAEFTCSNRY